LIRIHHDAGPDIGKRSALCSTVVSVHMSKCAGASDNPVSKFHQKAPEFPIFGSK
jgi:hypothetical protein